jgi:hypothetical protein
VKWPAIARHSDDAELIYLASPAELASEALRARLAYGEVETLIDVAGREYALTLQDGAVRLSATGVIRTLYDILGLVKAHSAQSGACCVAKLYAPTIGDAYAMVRLSVED